MASPNLSELSSITQRHFVPKLYDNIFDSNALLQRMRKGKSYEKISGGTDIVVPLLYATTAASGWYTGSGTLSTTASDQITAATYDWKTIYANITINRIDELKNSGPEQVVNFVKAKVQAAEKTMADTLGTAIFGSTTTNGIDGLEQMCATTGTYGAIAKGTYSWWQGQKDTTTTALTIAALRGAVGDATVDNDSATVIVTIQDFYDDLYGEFQPQQRFTDAETARGGFTNIMFEGRPVIVDSHCGSTDLFALNEKYISMKVHKDEDFRFEPFIKPTNQNSSTAKIYWAGALTSSNCRLQSWMSALT